VQFHPIEWSIEIDDANNNIEGLSEGSLQLARVTKSIEKTDEGQV
jgi:hypothetical protein